MAKDQYHFMISMLLGKLVLYSKINQVLLNVFWPTLFYMIHNANSLLQLLIEKLKATSFGRYGKLEKCPSYIIFSVKKRCLL